ncbi:hypothetical protein Cflav_PD1272 [Pedosphaera parvula Ellin514]|uniref:Uncharacterized protein n=1 Tax=Pedosphaera parvula (strain Ellin514) TaxID=320771 RepID=B9XP82_PEDPL|nr:hypothetical protein Cflav_PD1272 [Pedosphaera parvula Ellin514]
MFLVNHQNKTASLNKFPAGLSESAMIYGLINQKTALAGGWLKKIQLRPFWRAWLWFWR